MHINYYNEIRRKVKNTEHGYLIDKWQNTECCESDYEFFRQYSWVVISANLSNKAALKIFDNVIYAIKIGNSTRSVFNHDKKASAIEYIFKHRNEVFDKYNKIKNVNEKLYFLNTLPWIGPTNRYHLARNLGLDVCKPDRHLKRIADYYNTTPDKLCQKLSNESGDRIGVVDYVIWRAGNLNMI